MATVGIGQATCNAAPVRQTQISVIVNELTDRTQTLQERITLLIERLIPITFDKQVLDKQQVAPPKQQVCPLAFTIRESVERIEVVTDTINYLLDNLEI